jgi:hypothetical protein
MSTPSKGIVAIMNINYRMTKVYNKAKTITILANIDTRPDRETATEGKPYVGNPSRRQGPDAGVST